MPSFLAWCMLHEATALSAALPAVLSLPAWGAGALAEQSLTSSKTYAAGSHCSWPQMQVVRDEIYSETSPAALQVPVADHELQGALCSESHLVAGHLLVPQTRADSKSQPRKRPAAELAASLQHLQRCLPAQLLYCYASVQALIHLGSAWLWQS